jgi:hypothetical protein
VTDRITPDLHSSLVGGSTAARRIGCPRSYALEQLVPRDDRGSVYAQEGTALHAMMAMTMVRDLEPTSLLPFTFTPEDCSWSFTVDSDLWYDKGEPALRAFDGFVCREERRLGEPMRFLIETTVQFPGIADAFGTADIIAACRDEIFVLDWKFGRGIVPATENKQLLFYACGALNSARDFFDGMTLTDETPVTMAIIQPTLEEGIDIWRTDMSRLHRYEAELKAVIETIRSQGKDAPIQDGPWCTFARCKAVCPLHLGAAAKLAARFSDLQNALAGKTAQPDDWPERFADMLELADMLEDWCKVVRDMAHAEAERGMAIPGWVLEPGRKGPRRWAMSDKDVIESLAARGFDLDIIAPRKLLTPPQAERILKRANISIPNEWVSQTESPATRLVRAENATETVEPAAERAKVLVERLMKM